MESKKDSEKKLKPAGSYLDSLSDFADLLGTIRQAEKAAGELLSETSLPRIPSKTDVGSDVGGSVPDKRSGEAGSPEESAKAPDGEPGNVKTVDEMLAQLDELVGLDNIKRSVKSLINYVKIRGLRKENELPNPPLSLHMVFMGNPGTGKTTVARILSELYRAIGALSKGQLIEVDRGGLVAGFVGQTAIKTAEVINSALGGILFIDEAYSLAPEGGGGNDFGREAIETLLKMMEDNRGNLIVIVAGYSGPMERFIASNPGLESRFNRWFMFEDYDGGELYEIFSSMCLKSEYVLTEDGTDFVRRYFSELYDTRDENFGNARHVRNFFENVVAVHSDRVSAMESHTREDLITVMREDVEAAALV